MDEVFALMVGHFWKAAMLISLYQLAARAEDRATKRYQRSRIEEDWSEYGRNLLAIQPQIIEKASQLPPEMGQQVAAFNKLLGHFQELVNRANNGEVPDWDTYQKPATEAMERYRAAMTAEGEKAPF